MDTFKIVLSIDGKEIIFTQPLVEELGLIDKNGRCWDKITEAIEKEIPTMVSRIKYKI